MEEELLNWYNKMNEEIEGSTKIIVPVITTDNEPKPETEICTDGESEVPAEKDDPVVTKDKQNALMSFVMTKRIQDLLVKVAALNEPYETNSEERQGIVDTVKELYIKLGDTIGKL